MDVIFFPRNDYPYNVEICPHRLGKRMTYTEQTDGVLYNISYPQFTALAKTRGIKLGCFYNIGYTDPSVADESVRAIVKNDAENGDVWFDIYSMTESLFYKITNRLSISEQEFINAYQTELLPSYQSVFGVDKKPLCLSYAYGNESFSNYITQYFLGARNSGYNADTDYGNGYGNPNNQPYSKLRFKSKQGSTRWYDQAKDNNNDFAGQLEIQSALIDATLLNGGWLNNFTHWHNYWQDGNQQWAETYLDLLAEKNENDEIYFAGYGEAVAYLVYRQMITRAVMYSPNAHANDQLIIRIEAKNTLDVDTDLLQVPISVKFSTVGTPLEGQSIKSSCNLISLGNGQYIVEIPYAEYAGAVIEKVNV